MKAVFFISLTLIFYHLVFFGIILEVMSKFVRRRKKNILENHHPTITIIVAAYNEEENIKLLLNSFNELDYPAEKLNLLIVSDDSTDCTNKIVSDYAGKYNNIKLVIQQPRSGKVSALNLVEPRINSELVVSADASSNLKKNSIKILVKHFSDPEIGLVSGKMIYTDRNGEISSEGLYWRYESWLRHNESDLHSIIGASGCLFAIRRNLYNQIHPSSPDDFERTLITLSKGYRTVYEPDAIVYEVPTTHSNEELVRKIRMISTEWFALFRNSVLLNPVKFPMISFFLFSHKLIRWLLSFISIGMLIPSFVLQEYLFFRILFISQIVLYAFASAELIIEKKGKSIKMLKLPGYWLAMNIASFVAFMKFLSGNQQKTWETKKTD